MVKAIVDIDKEANRLLNIVKAEYGLKDKSQAINKLVSVFGDMILDSQIRPEYLRKLKRIKAGKFNTYSSVRALREELEDV